MTNHHDEQLQKNLLLPARGDALTVRQRVHQAAKKVNVGARDRDARVAALLGISVTELTELEFVIRNPGHRRSMTAAAAAGTVLTRAPRVRSRDVFVVGTTRTFHLMMSCESITVATNRVRTTTKAAAVADGRSECLKCRAAVEAESLLPLPQDDLTVVADDEAVVAA
jgi:hypothetical protein